MRQARERAGVSVADLAKRLGVAVEIASALELRDEQGAAESGAVEQALEALGLARWDVVLGKEELAAIEKNARDIAKRTAWTMELESQHLPQSQIEEIVAVLVARGVAIARRNSQSPQQP